MDKRTKMVKHNPPLDIRTRCTLFLAFLTWTFCFSHPACHLTMLTIILGTGLSAGMPLKKMLSGLLPLAPLFIMIMIFSGVMPAVTFVHDENTVPIAQLGDTLTLTRGGLLLGTTFVLRLANMVIGTRMLLAATPLEAFISLFAWLRMPPSLSFMITTALRFIPALDGRRQLISAAQQARGADPASGSWVNRFKARAAVMIPLIVSAISIADQLTMALMNRGFGYTARPTAMTRLQFNPRDVVITALALVAGLLAVFIGWRTDFWQI